MIKKKLLKFEAEGGREFAEFFDIIRAIYSNSERSKQFLKRNAFLSCSWWLLRSVIQYKNSKKYLGFRNLQEKLENSFSPTLLVKTGNLFYITFNAFFPTQKTLYVLIIIKSIASLGKNSHKNSFRHKVDVTML